MNSRLPVIVLFLSSIGWGITWWPVKELNALGLDNLWLVFIAYAAGTIVLLPWFYLQ
ncbi:MAG: EamA protein, partial [Pseudomonadota bacterium]|nr:EamA protein [Pseudomonadota bacterium]